MDLFLAFVFGVLYTAFQAVSIYGGDSGELVAAASVWGIAHPPGYPLYVLLGNILVRALPWGTPAWRVGFLSSLPMAASVAFTYSTVRELTGRRTPALASAVMYGLAYPVWLYGSVPEVFGLFAFFSSAALFLFVRWTKTGQDRYMGMLAGLAGLSLAHHHLIVLLWGTAALTVFRSYPSLWLRVRKRIIPLVITGFAGFAVYLYAPIASSFHPPLDWENASTVAGFVRLVTRASYGTFSAGAGAGTSIIDRMMDIFAFSRYVVHDFTVFGIAAVIAGFVAIRRTDRRLYGFFLSYTAVLVFYFFYAGFPLTDEFFVGTLERFFVVPFQFVAVCMGMGLAAVTAVAEKRLPSARKAFGGIVAALIAIVFAGPAIVVGTGNFPAMRALATDRTLERVASDAFSSVTPMGILIPQSDTLAFTALYAYYALHMRPDIRLINPLMLTRPQYLAYAKSAYPDLIFPDCTSSAGAKTCVADFVYLNSKTRAVLAENRTTIRQGYWVPHGLLLKYYPTGESIPDDMAVMDTNAKLWRTYGNPYGGALGTYRHLLLTDAARIYASKLSSYATGLIRVGKYDEAAIQIRKAISYGPTIWTLQLQYASVLTRQGKCREARDVFAAEVIPNLPSDEYEAVELPEFRKACPDYPLDSGLRYGGNGDLNIR